MPTIHQLAVVVILGAAAVYLILELVALVGYWPEDR